MFYLMVNQISRHINEKPSLKLKMAFIEKSKVKLFHEIHFFTNGVISYPESVKVNSGRN